MKKVNQKDIAASLNISRVTVTKALKDHPDIAVKTRELIKQKAKELGYVPDFIGRSLSSKRTHIIGIVLPKIAHSFFSYSVEKFYEAALKKGYHVLPMISFEDDEVESKNIQTLLSMRADGLIIDVAGKCKESSHYEFAKRSGCKILFYDRCLNNTKDGAILTNDRKSAYDLTKLMIKKGYKRICHFAGPSLLSIASERQRGYEDAMKEENLIKNICNVDFTIKGGYNAMMKLANENELPEAIFAVNDSVAHGIYDAVNELGLKIPGDIAVAGFGDIESSRFLTPPLTSVSMPISEMTKSAINTIIDMIETNSDFKERVIFNSTIVIRNSI
jgi:DNA-binding LacI/PurR family transcriptional regulator